MRPECCLPSGCPGLTRCRSRSGCRPRYGRSAPAVSRARTSSRRWPRAGMMAPGVRTSGRIVGGPARTEVDPEVLAFWARAMVARTGAHASSPTRIGPIWLGHVLGEYVPRTFEVSAVQRAGLAPAVTAWARWAAHQQGFDDVAVARLVERVAEIDASFDTSYDEPAVVALRAYVSDIAADDRDGAELEQVRPAATTPSRSPNAAPSRPPSAAQRSRATTPDPRQAPEGLVPARHRYPTEWLTALQSVSDQLWDAAPPATGRRGPRLHGGCPAPAEPSPPTNSTRSTSPPAAAATTRSWTPCCRAFTPRPPAGAAEHSRCA